MGWAAGDNLPDGAADALRAVLSDIAAQLAQTHPELIEAVRAIQSAPGWRPWWERRGGGPRWRARDADRSVPDGPLGG